MLDQYFVVNIRAYLDKNELTYIGEDGLSDILSEFSCPQNPDVEYFLLNNAIEFTKKNQSITYIVLNTEGNLVGYFSLAVKPIAIHTESISKTTQRKLARVSVFDEENCSYNPAAYLIAQLGKNYAVSKEQRIEGTVLLRFALDAIEKLQYSVGGVIEFLECEDNDFLMNFYTGNEFRLFDTRMTDASKTSESHKLNQLFRLI